MPIDADPAWMQLAVYAVAAAVGLTLLFRIPKLGSVLRGLFSIALLAFGIFVFLQQAPFHPNLSGFAAKIGIGRQAVEGGEVRIPMSGDGHFWAQVSLNGAPRRMLIDSGATVTALSDATAKDAGIKPDTASLPVMIRTANGMVAARTGTVDRLTFGALEAKGLKVVITPSLGGIDVLGMNFLTELASWRVEGRTLVLVPARPAAP
jgi:aspartyl protease family protein